MNKVLSIMTALLACFISGCSTVSYEKADNPVKFYGDKLNCETVYSEGYTFFGSKEYGDIYKNGPAKDCMLAKGYTLKNTP